MFLKLLVVAVAVALAQASGDSEEFVMFVVDKIYPLGLGPYQCHAGVPDVRGCALKMPNGQFLIISPLYVKNKFVVLKEVHPFIGGRCKYGIPTVEGCALQDSDRTWVILSPVQLINHEAR